MKKLLLTLVIAVSAAISANAQFGLGFGFANSSLHSKVEDFKTAEGMNGLFIEGAYTFHIGNHFGITPAVQYEWVKEGNIETLKEAMQLIGKKASWSEHYLNVPVRFSYGFNVGKVIGLGTYAAPTFSVGLASKINADGNKIDIYDVGGESIEEDNMMSRFDFMIGLGLYCDLFQKFRVRFGYDYGLVNRAADSVKDGNLHRGQIQLGVSFLF